MFSKEEIILKKQKAKEMSDNKSLWMATASAPRFDKLDGDIKTDVLIIGGGMAGVLCAYMLKEAGVDCILCESDRIFSGVTGNTTAKITYQHGLIYDSLIRRFGIETAALYLQAGRNAVDKYERLSKKILCDFEPCDSYVYSLSNRDKIEREVRALERLGAPAEFVESIELPFKTMGAVCVKKQGQFHPLKFGYGIAAKLPIYENTRITELVPGGAMTDSGKITAEKIIVATHFPFINKHGAYFLKLYQHRSYVLALEGAEDVFGMYKDEDEKGLSFRNYGKYLLLGGGSHRTGKRGGGWSELVSVSNKLYPGAKPVYRWATQDCMTLDGIPYIGRYSKRTTDLYVVTGFNKWGMTSSMVGATVLSDLVQGKQSKYEGVFSPSRSIIHPQIALNALESMIGLVTPIAPRCPHLGCALKYNRAEHSWDCPCHGSRFDEHGKLLDGPATDDKNKI